MTEQDAINYDCAWEYCAGKIGLETVQATLGYIPRQLETWMGETLSTETVTLIRMGAC